MDEKIRVMSQEKVAVALLKFGFPAMIGLFVVALYNFVDAIFIAGLGTSEMGAAAISFPISMVIIGLGLTLGSGVASYISRLLGENKIDQANKAVATAFFGSLILGVVVILPALLFLTPLLKAFGASETILPFAKAYGTIFIGGSILNVINVTMNNIIRAQGAAKTSMYALIIGALLNIILDPIFIYLLGLGIRGAAIATVISQAVSTALLLKYFFSEKSILKISFKHISFSREIIGEILKVGTPSLIFQLLSSASMGLINVAATPYGDAVVAAFGIVNRIFAIGSFVIFGFYKGFQPLAGFNYGAKNFQRLKLLRQTAFRWTILFCMGLGLVQIIFSRQIVGLFSDNVTVLDIGCKALIAYSMILPLYGVQIFYMTLFLSLGKATQGGILSFSRQGFFFIPLILTLPQLFGLSGVIYAQVIADVLTTVVTMIMAYKFNGL